MSNVQRLNLLAHSFPKSVVEMLDGQRWQDLEQALDNGLSPNLFGDEITLFEAVLIVLENSRGMTTSSAKGPVSLLESFIRHGLDKGPLVDTSGVTAVELAATYGQWEWMKSLVKAGFQVENIECSSILSSLVDGRMVRCESELVPEESAGANVVALHENEGTVVPRMESPQETERVMRAIQFLVRNGADVNAVDPDTGKDPLSSAIIAFDEAAVAGLIMADADIVSKRDVAPYGLISPLELAVATGSPDMVSLLMPAWEETPVEGDPLIHNMRHPFAMACKLSHCHLLDTIYSHMDPQTVPELGAAAMHLAAANGRITAMRYLRVYGIHYDAPYGPDKYQPIHQAAANGQEKAIEFLERRGYGLNTISETHISAAELLRVHHSHLAKKFGVESRGTHEKVHLLKPRKGP